MDQSRKKYYFKFIKIDGKQRSRQSVVQKDKYFCKNIYFFHSRLSIIDLKSRSNQPFKYQNLFMIFNGEIYNYLELKTDLKKRDMI